MKRWVPAFLFLAACIHPHTALADSVQASTFVGSLIDHVHAQTVFDFKGRQRLELSDSVFQVIPYKGSYLMEAQAGFSGLTKPAPDEPTAAGWIASAYVRLDPYVKNLIAINPNYSFLQALEFGPIWGYDFREHHGYAGIQANLAFTLQPIK